MMMVMRQGVAEPSSSSMSVVGAVCRDCDVRNDWLEMLDLVKVGNEGGRMNVNKCKTSSL
jgi:hypothetical protein